MRIRLVHMHPVSQHLRFIKQSHVYPQLSDKISDYNIKQFQAISLQLSVDEYQMFQKEAHMKILHKCYKMVPVWKVVPQVICYMPLLLFALLSSSLFFFNHLSTHLSICLHEVSCIINHLMLRTRPPT